MAKKTIKQGFFCHALIEIRKREKDERGQRSNKHHHFYTVFGALKNRQEVVPPFWAPGEAGGSHFLGKGYVRQRAQKDNCFWGL